MKALSIGLGIFILTCSAGAEVFLETFDDRNVIKQWQELTIVHLGKLEAVLEKYLLYFVHIRC